MSKNELIDALGLNTLRRRQWFIQTSCALSGDPYQLGAFFFVINKRSKEIESDREKVPI